MRTLAIFVLKARSLKDDAMLGLYGTNISYGTLFPGLDGLARSMGYESEYNGSTSANAADNS